MTPEKTVLLIGHKTETVRTAKAFGLDVVLFQHPTKIDPVQAKLADATFFVDYTDWSVVGPLARAAHEIWRFPVALSLTEPGLEIAGRVNDLLGLGGTGYEVSHRLRDKWEMRRHLAASGAVTIGAELVDGRDSLASFGARHGYPFIVKPTDMTAGYGVHRVTGPQDIDEVYAEVLHLRKVGVTRGTTLFTIQEFIMEEYVSGPEFSVEAFSFAGRHVVLAVTEKLVDEAHFAELGHALPARLGREDEDAIVAAVTAFLDTIGVKDGPSHTEVRLSERGPIVIEGHNRIGGDRIRDLVTSAYGIDLLTYTVGWPFRLVDELPDRPPALGGACVRFLHGETGQVAAVDGIEEVRADPAVLATELSVKPGDTIRSLQDNWDRLGLVAVSGPDTDAAVELCERLIDSVTVRTAAPALAHAAG
ncbi:ATP-grasp domain-containing protein [Planotetraspora sp. A-T 1434]|uniref:ATP-grasp domain-containing protein n=1 Tax=Planotetraspora sp. A-T 1434 TaxID=2979219 RepID=UPI0021C0CC83|nr:ATP-grasp domain-containing protein [Planotetraspora sp. A-T 1434]MCT9933583.1 ATP-grasp domain-containing protein [Planotetraspora sp. A-T 1434]